MSIDKNLLKRFLHDYPFQPATGIWRAVEIAQVTKQTFPTGCGLDLGCGDGKLTQIIVERMAPIQLIGIDVDPLETEQAKQTGIYSQVYTAPAHQIPVADGFFDFVFSNSVLEHINNIDEVLPEIARVMKSAATFLFTVPSNDFHRCLRGSLLPWVSRQSYLEEIDKRLAHYRYWNIEEWSEHLNAVGLEMSSISYYLTQSETRRWETISRFTAGILFTVFGKNQRPIEIQRTLGMRKANKQLPNWLANWLSRLLSIGLTNHEQQEELYGCFLIQAHKR